MQDFLTAITPAQRMDMISKGLSPLNETHVKKYLNTGGKIRGDVKDNVKRITHEAGIGGIRTNLGSGTEREEYPVAANGLDFTVAETNDDPRQSLREDMNSYVNTPVNRVGLDDFDVDMPSNKTTSKHETRGYDETIAYLNTFIKSITQPGIANRLGVFKKIKALLMLDEKYKANAAAHAEFRAGCIRAEREFYNRIKRK